VTCSPCLPDPPLLFCLQQILNVCIGLINLSRSHSLCHLPVVRSSYNCLHWLGVIRWGCGWGVYWHRTLLRTPRTKCCVFNCANVFKTSVGAPTIDTMVGEPQLVVKNTCVCLSNLSSKTKYDAVLYTQSWGANMQCNTQAHHHEHTNDGHVNVVMHRMQYAIT
jgi:hypothetical protein